jgi:solute carrier family 25 uncoupling protein 27
MKALSGATAGAVGQLFASPTDLVKVRLQAQNRAQHSAINAVKYKGMTDAFYRIIKEEGVVSLWKGVGPNVQRAALVNLGELATYDQSKEFVVSLGLPLLTTDSVITHTFASVMSGYASADR